MKTNFLFALLIIFLTLFFLDSSCLAQKGGNNCDKKLWNFVWEPKRLQLLDKCKTVSGVIEKNADPDGDEHMLLKLDAGQEKLLNKKNYTKKDGNLVIEAVCINHITRKIAKGICWRSCKGYRKLCARLP
jgi:hypothetical protein